jgi:ectoine hydroxylase-related dioxygenase (phytanoyl-CoA dioxygenase family)
MSLEVNLESDAESVGGLTPEEVAYFRREGFVLPREGLPPDVVQHMRGLVDHVVRDNAEWANLLRMVHVPRRPGQLEGVIGGEEVFKLIFHPVLLRAAASILGPNLIMWGSEMFAKPPGVGKGTPWHQDCYNPAIKSGKGEDRVTSLMVWIAVDNIDRGNGCLRFIPGSGRNGKLEHVQHAQTDALLNFEADSKLIDPSKAVDSIRAPGQFSIHDYYVVHGAEPNTSNRRRAGLTFHYISSEDMYDRSFGSARGSGLKAPAPLAVRPIWLVLGENKNPVNDFVTGHQGLEDLDDYAERTRRQMTTLIN